MDFIRTLQQSVKSLLLSLPETQCAFHFEVPTMPASPVLSKATTRSLATAMSHDKPAHTHRAQSFAHGFSRLFGVRHCHSHTHTHTHTHTRTHRLYTTDQTQCYNFQVSKAGTNRSEGSPLLFPTAFVDFPSGFLSSPTGAMRPSNLTPQNTTELRTAAAIHASKQQRRRRAVRARPALATVPTPSVPT